MKSYIWIAVLAGIPYIWSHMKYVGCLDFSAVTHRNTENHEQKTSKLWTISYVRESACLFETIIMNLHQDRWKEIAVHHEEDFWQPPSKTISKS